MVVRAKSELGKKAMIEFIEEGGDEDGADFFRTLMDSNLGGPDCVIGIEYETKEEEQPLRDRLKKVTRTIAQEALQEAREKL